MEPEEEEEKADEEGNDDNEKDGPEENKKCNHKKSHIPAPPAPRFNAQGSGAGSASYSSRFVGPALASVKERKRRQC